MVDFSIQPAWRWTAPVTASTTSGDVARIMYLRVSSYMKIIMDQGTPGIQCVKRIGYVPNTEKRPKLSTEFRRPCCLIDSQRVLQINRSAHWTTTIDTQYAACECMSAFFWTMRLATFWHCLISPPLGPLPAAICAGVTAGQFTSHAPSQ